MSAYPSADSCRFCAARWLGECGTCDVRIDAGEDWQECEQELDIHDDPRG